MTKEKNSLKSGGDTLGLVIEVKLLFERWRKHIKERFESIPAPIETPDIGDIFPQLDVNDIISEPTKNIGRKLALLGMFNKLEKETDGMTIRNILTAMRQFAGNSPDFTFQSKKEAQTSYDQQNKYKAYQNDAKPTKSLRDWHDHLKVISDHSSALRSDRLHAFAQSAEPTVSKPSSNVDPHDDTEKYAAPTIKSKTRNIRLTVRPLLSSPSVPRLNLSFYLSISPKSLLLGCIIYHFPRNVNSLFNYSFF